MIKSIDETLCLQPSKNGAIIEKLKCLSVKSYMHRVLISGLTILDFK